MWKKQYRIVDRRKFNDDFRLDESILIDTDGLKLRLKANEYGNEVRHDEYPIGEGWHDTPYDAATAYVQVLADAFQDEAKAVMDLAKNHRMVTPNSGRS